MTNKDKKIQRTAKCLSAFGVIALLSLAFRLWQVFVADEIFYASGGKKSESDTEPAAGKKKPAKEEEGEFTGFEKPGNFGSFYDE